jgi:hypothetical protein
MNKMSFARCISKLDSIFFYDIPPRFSNITLTRKCFHYAIQLSKAVINDKGWVILQTDPPLHDVESLCYLRSSFGPTKKENSNRLSIRKLEHWNRRKNNDLIPISKTCDN